MWEDALQHKRRGVRGDCTGVSVVLHVHHFFLAGKELHGQTGHPHGRDEVLRAGGECVSVCVCVSECVCVCV